jgi:hypothetical protein
VTDCLFSFWCLYIKRFLWVLIFAPCKKIVQGRNETAYISKNYVAFVVNPTEKEDMRIETFPLP